MLVFISHGGQDTWVARQIEREVRAAGAETFLDEANVEIHEAFPNVIRDYLNRSDELVVLLTPWSLQRPWVWIEVGAAFQRSISIVGILHGMSREDLHSNASIPVILLERNLVQLNDVDRYFTQLRDRITGGVEGQG